MATRTPPHPRRVRSAPHVRFNRRLWDRTSAAYERRCESVLRGRYSAAWGLWRTPESELQLLGPVRGRRILEIGCGAARWSIALRQRGAVPVGLDVSREQLRRANALVRASRRSVALIQASAERVPIRGAAFDVVFCDWGALTFTDPKVSIPECARLLRPGGALVFSTASPFSWAARDEAADRQVRRLVRPYFGIRRLVTETIDFQLTYGEWIALFRSAGLTVERLVESRARRGSKTPYLAKSDAAWARRWPLECIWKLRRDATPSRRPATRPARRGARPSSGGRRRTSD